MNVKSNSPSFLVCCNNGSTHLLAKVEKGKVIFMEKTLMKTMRTVGIAIPPKEREKFEGKSVVLLEDNGNQLFENAFRNIYCNYSLPKNIYKWVESYDEQQQ